MFNWDIYHDIYNTLDDPFGIICVLTKKDDVNLKVFNMITRINKSKALTKHISCEYKCKINWRNLHQKWETDKLPCECKETIKLCVQKILYLKLQYMFLQNHESLESIIGDSVIMCHPL